MAQVGSLYASLTLESTSFITNMKRAADATERGSRAIDKSLGIAKAGVAGFLGALSVDAVTGFVTRALDFAGSLGEVSQQLGVSTRSLQTYRYAATQVGISQEIIDKGLAKFTRTLGEARNGSASAQKAFADAGISLKELARLDTDTGIKAVADSLAAIPDPAKRAAIEVALFGRAGQQLDTLLAGGSKQINELAGAAEKLGIVLSDSQIQKADETADKLAAIKTVIAANFAGVVADNADAILSLATSLGKLGAAVVNFPDLPRNHPILTGTIAGGAAGFLTPIPGGALGGAAIGATGGALYGIRQRNEAAERAKFGGQTQREIDAAIIAALPKGSDLQKKFSKEYIKKYNIDVAAKVTPLGLQEVITLPDKKKKGKKETDHLADYLASLPPLADEVGRKFDQLGTDIQGALVNLPENVIDPIKIDMAELAAITETGLKPFAEMIKLADEAKKRSTQFAENLTNGLGQALIYGQSLGDALVNSIQAAAAELVSSQLLTLLTGGKDGKGGLIGAAGTFFGALFKPKARANGGPVTAGTPYMVGERGPELFNPSTSGNIIPNGAMRGMGGRSVVVNQTFAPSFAGNAATKQDLLQMGAIVKAETMTSVKDALSRRGSWR